jgi:hypothetical protein
MQKHSPPAKNTLHLSKYAPQTYNNTFKDSCTLQGSSYSKMKLREEKGLKSLGLKFAAASLFALACLRCGLLGLFLMSLGVAFLVWGSAGMWCGSLLCFWYRVQLPPWLPV